MKIILSNQKPTTEQQRDPNFYSVECGVNDDVRHFDHHDIEGAISPCARYIETMSSTDLKSATIQISHICCDTFLTLAYLVGDQDKIGYRRPKEFDHISMKGAWLNELDNHGTSAQVDGVQLSDDHDTFKFYVGVGKLARKLKFPRVTEQEQDVTKIIKKMLKTSTLKIRELGKQALSLNKDVFEKCFVEECGNTGLWAVDRDDDFDPSYPYREEYSIVVVYRKHFKSISLYTKLDIDLRGTTASGITFAGHAQACGSERGVERTLDEAKQVLNDLRSQTSDIFL